MLYSLLMIQGKCWGTEYIIKSFGELVTESRDRTLNKQGDRIV